jgi:hypothetical protein
MKENGKKKKENRIRRKNKICPKNILYRVSISVGRKPSVS